MSYCKTILEQLNKVHIITITIIIIIIIRYTDVQVHRCTGTPMYRYTDVQVHRCTGQVYHNI